MSVNDRICLNCGKRYGQHYGMFCSRKDLELYSNTGKMPSEAFVVIEQKRTINAKDPNALFKRKKDNA